ncbi:S8 family serine peptidase [bacterium]|nr:S8 family serine peptidase [bacterium]
MKKKIILLLTIVAVFLIASIPASAESVESPYVLVFKMNKLPADVDAFVADAGGKLTIWMPQVGIAIATSDSADFADIASANASVSEVGLMGKWSLPVTQEFGFELAAPTSTDVYYEAYQWDIRRVGAPEAWDVGVTGSHDTVVAVIDTGVDASHPDLADNVVYEECIQLAGFCAPGTFTADHGTHVAGTIAAAFDGGKAVGVGPNLGIAAYQVFEDNDDGAWDGPIWWAILDAADQGFAAINMSLGGYDAFYAGGSATWTAWNRVVNYAINKGVTVVASAGNDGVNVNGSLFHIPGDLPGVINVGATGIQPAPFYPQEGSYDISAFYSNYGAAVDLVAPGGDCGELFDCTGNPPSGYPYYLYLVFSTVPGGYAWMGGTSMATPHVTAAAALIKDVNPDLNPNQVSAILTRTADKIGSRQLFGHGMLNVYEAVMEAMP